jgi:hypothetical protein
MYKELKAYLIENSKYDMTVDTREPNKKKFPIVIVSELSDDSIYTTLKYTDEIYYMDLEINTYAIQNGNIPNKTIAEETTNLIEQFFKDNYRVSIRTTRDVPNLDTNVYRNLTTVSFKIETKYKDKLVISPR